ncbi:Cc8L18.2-like protein [Daphnia magna]|uniref:Cc8L18.2-like protein n=1 Tax=Daphnia magna TaxID=35525 RepID=A0A164SPW5_9CRUS|nr:Cc8L18.2-like protein [Daphnia magna]
MGENQKLPNCCVGNIFHNRDCHQLIHTTKKSNALISDLPLTDQRVIKLRVQSENIETICAHHYYVFFIHYANAQKNKKCCDPFDKHDKKTSKGIQVISIELSDFVIKATGNIRLIPGKKLCPRCYKQAKDFNSIDENSEPHYPECVDDEFSVNITPRKVISALVDASFISPVANLNRCSKKRRLNLFEKVIDSVKRNVMTESDDSPIFKVEDYSRLMSELREKIHSASNSKEQYSLLTLAPSSWTQSQTASYFGVSLRAAAKASALYRENGILPKAEGGNKRKGGLTEDDEKRIVEFYTSDEFSRQLPGMKNVKSVKQADGKRLNVQKRLLLVNIDELHRDYKKKLTSDGLRAFGLSVFASLRPPNVITVGSSGTHSVCVCVYHQNVKLRLAAIHIIDERYYFMDKLVCNVYNKDCMMTRCASCPGTEILRQFLSDLSDEEEEQIIYKKWTQTDGSKLETITEEKEEFIESLVKLISNLTKHHYIARSQSSFFAQSKANVGIDSCVLVSDFSENFAFIIQDAIQGYYWMNDSATLLPFMAYMKNENGSAFNVPLCVISDHSTHDTLAVHAFLRPVLTHLKSINPLLKKVIYFTDGAASQYKNKKNFANLCSHEADFGLMAEWHFFASCHGKSACDGIGGTLKRLARLASLQRHSNNHITSPEQLFNWATENVDIKTFYVSSHSVQSNAATIERRMEQASVVQGTRSLHCYVPLNSFQLKASPWNGFRL